MVPYMAVETRFISCPLDQNGVPADINITVPLLHTNLGLVAGNNGPYVVMAGDWSLIGATTRTVRFRSATSGGGNTSAPPTSVGLEFLGTCDDYSGYGYLTVAWLD